MKKKVLKLITTLLLLTIVVSNLVACTSQKPAVVDNPKTESESKRNNQEKFVFKLGHLADEENTWHKGAMKFAELVSERSNGRVEIKIYPNEQLGNELDTITGILAGTADMVVSGESLQNWAPKVGVMAAPYAIETSEQLRKVVDGEIGQEIEKEIIEKAGLRPLFWYERGPRYLTSNRPITTPDDLQGIILRIPNVPIFVKSWEALGAKPTPMALSEVFTSLQQHTIEAQENPLALIYSSGFYEVQKYVNETAHVRSWIYVSIGEKQWQSLPQDLQQIMLDAAKEAQAYENELFKAEEEALVGKLKEKGMTFHPVDQAAFKEKVVKALEETLTAEQLELYEKIKNVK